MSSCTDNESEDNAALDWLLSDESVSSESNNKEAPKQNDSSLNLNITAKNSAEKLLDVSVTIELYDSYDKVISIGSGVFVRTNYVATNFHVIDNDYQYIKIKRNSDNNEFEGEIYKLDTQHDVAILKTTFFCEKPVQISKSQPTIGEDILVAGSPIGLEGTISKGIVSAIRKFEPYNYELIQISAPISKGSSGGPVVNEKGELIGITVSYIQGGQNLNFAVPVKYIDYLFD